jgi:hypothetical protein
MPLWKFLAASILSKRARAAARRFHVGGHVAHHVPFPAEVLHELAGQLDGVPFDAVDAGDGQVVHPGEQVVQAVAGFVEQGDHVVVAEGGGLATHRAGEVAHQVGDRGLDAAGMRRRVIAESIQAPPFLVSRA